MSNPFIYLSIYLITYMSIYLSVHYCFHLSIHGKLIQETPLNIISVHLYIYRSKPEKIIQAGIFPSVLSINQFIYLSINQFIYLSIYSTIHLSKPGKLILADSSPFVLSTSLYWYGSLRAIFHLKKICYDERDRRT